MVLVEVVPSLPDVASTIPDPLTRNPGHRRHGRIAEATPARAPVIDLMEALQESLRKPAAKAGAREAATAPARPVARPRGSRKRGAA